MDLCIRVLRSNYKLALNRNALVYHYPLYSFSSYVRKQYLSGISQGIFRAMHPDKIYKLNWLKIAIMPILALNNFRRRLRECSRQKIFTRGSLREILLIYLWINAGYLALYLGELSYLIRLRALRFGGSAIALEWRRRIKNFLSITKDLSIYFIGLFKHYLKKIALPVRRSFIFYISARCNENCRHCFYSGSLNKGEEEFSLSEIGPLAKIFRGNISLGLTGGEPFLRDDLPEIVSIFRKEGIRSFQINTNGILTEKILGLAQRLLKEKTDFIIVVSLDGLEPTHDRIRNSPGSFQKTVNTLNGLKALGAKIGIIVTINKLNYKELKSLVRFINTNFEIEPGLQLIRGPSQSRVPLEARNRQDPLDKELMLSKEIIPQIRGILDELYLEKARLEPFRSVGFARRLSYLNFHLDILENGEKIFNCRAGKNLGVIYPNGEVGLCEMSKPIGNLREVNFKLDRLWQSAFADRQRLFLKNCICTHDCFINTENNFRFAGSLVLNLLRFAKDV